MINIMALNIEIPSLEHKYIKLYDSQDEQQSDEVNYEECCYYIIKNPNAGLDNEATYQYSIRTTNNDNEKLGHYYSVETPDVWSGLEIIWGYFGWEWIDYEWNEETLKGGNLFLKISTNTVRTIPDGNRLQHINNFLGSQDNITHIETFDNSNIISAMTLNGYRDNSTVRQLILDISDWNNVENAKGMFENIQLTVANNELNLPKAKDCSYIFNSVAGTTITFDWSFPLAENLSYAFYNIEGNIAPLNDNLFKQDNVTNIDYCFGADDLKQINVNIIEIPSVITAKGLFRARIINNNNNNNISLPVCQYLDYVLEECDLSQVGNINFTSNALISAKGLIKNSTINNDSDTFINSLQYITNFNLVEDFSEYMMNMNHDTVNKSIEFDISGQTGSNEVILINFFTNANLNIRFKGNSRCNYNNFCNNAILNIDSESIFTGGISYNTAFLDSIFSGKCPIDNIEANKDYNSLYNNCIFTDADEITISGISTNTRDIFLNCNFADDTTFINFQNLQRVDLNFSVGDSIKELFDYTISDNTSDYGYGDDFIGYKAFIIEPDFNYKTIKEQTINVLIQNDEGTGTSTVSRYLIDNNNVTDLSNLTLNLIAKSWQQTNGEQIQDYNITVLRSSSMTHTPKIRGDISNGDYRSLSLIRILNTCPSLIELDIDLKCGYQSYIEIDNETFIYPKFHQFTGRLRFTSEIIDTDVLYNSIINNGVSIYEFTIKQSVYNKYTEEQQSNIISKCNILNLIQ